MLRAAREQRHGEKAEDERRERQTDAAVQLERGVRQLILLARHELARAQQQLVERQTRELIHLRAIEQLSAGRKLRRQRLEANEFEVAARLEHHAARLEHELERTVGTARHPARLREDRLAQVGHEQQHAAQLGAGRRNLARLDLPVAEVHDAAGADLRPGALARDLRECAVERTVRPRAEQQGSREREERHHAREGDHRPHQSPDRHARGFERQHLAIGAHAPERHQTAHQHTERKHAGEHGHRLVEDHPAHDAGAEPAIDHEIREAEDAGGEHDGGEAEQREQRGPQGFTGDVPIQRQARATVDR